PSIPGYAPPVNTLAIVALVLSFVVSIGGIVCGHLALSQIKRTGESGREMALAGLIIGYVLSGVAVLAVVVWIVFAIIYLAFFGVLLTTAGVSAA
uniref:DUF4190 domain-containing protein n=1 Tax=Pseudolysinimonas sp. TaxID=2680009 RepID=UPI003783BBAB